MKKLVQYVVVVGAVGLLVGCVSAFCMTRNEALPHPSPLPPGEGELSAGVLKYGTIELVHTSNASPDQNQFAAKSTDELLNQLATCSVH
jgi:hypothetical protein